MSSSGRPPIEPLERRRLYAAVALHGQTLVVTGTANSANTITVALSPDLSQVVTNITWYTGGGARAKAHTLAKAFPVTDSISLVQIQGGARADRITIDQTYSPFPIATLINAGGGNDTVMGGDEPDTIFGGAGNDLLMGGAGNDSLRGQAGNDTLIGGPGDDFLDGRRGRDSLEGDAGNDTLYDPFGPDTMLGGAGNNAFYLHSLKTDKVNDFVSATDTLHLIPIPGTVANSTSFLSSLFPILSLL